MVIFNQQNNISLQGGVQFSTGGKAHKPQGMIRCNSEADSIVWMKEEKMVCVFERNMPYHDRITALE